MTLLLGGSAPYFEQLFTRYDSDKKIIWHYMNPQPRPCFNPTLLDDINKFQHFVVSTNSSSTDDSPQPINYVVLASGSPGVYSLGGDLDLFIELIRTRDREALFNYAQKSVAVLYYTAVNYDQPLTTIALVQGDALGAGLEAALSCDVIIAERQAKLGFPEILFNLFPGVGAYSLLARKIGARKTEKLIFSGKIYTAEELYQMDIVDVLADEGKGETELLNYVRSVDRYRNTYQSVSKARAQYDHISYDEIMNIATIWVDAAMKLSEKNLKVMERLVKAQNRKNADTAPDNMVREQAG